MATTTGNPWISTTAETVYSNPVVVRRMKWTPTTAGDDLLVKDLGGNTLWSLKAIAADSNQGISYIEELGFSVNGIVVEIIDHGTLYIFIK